MHRIFRISEAFRHFAFFYAAYDLDDMGEWIYAPSFPFNMMDLGPIQKQVQSALK